MADRAIGILGLFELAMDQMTDYPRDCDSIKQALIRQQVQLEAVVKAIRDQSDDTGKAELISSAQDVVLARQEFDKALKQFQKDCGEAKRTGRW